LVKFATARSRNDSGLLPLLLLLLLLLALREQLANL
jgi:hypothetical protein